VHALAVAEQTASYGAGAYLVVFAQMALTLAGIPAIGGAVVGWAAVLASQGELNIVAVLVVAALGAEAGGLAGYAIGQRWGRKVMEWRGPADCWGMPVPRRSAGNQADTWHRARHAAAVQHRYSSLSRPAARGYRAVRR
jgi:membrane protein DedA with SNARE-associated domain